MISRLVLEYDGSGFAGWAAQPAQRTVCGVVASALAVLFRRRIVDALSGRSTRLTPRQVTLLTILLGAALGALVSLTSVGAGALGMTVLLVLYPKREIAQLVGSDIAHAVPLTLLAGVGHWIMGTVDWSMLGTLLTGSIPGIILGSLLAPRTPDGVLRPLLAATLALVGWKLLA